MSRKKTFSSQKISFVEFDTQDNLVTILDTVDSTYIPYVQNLDLETFEILEDFGLRIISDKKVDFKSKKPLKGVSLNNFPHIHKVKKISDFHFEIESNSFRKYFDGTDYIEVLTNQY